MAKVEGKLCREQRKNREFYVAVIVTKPTHVHISIQNGRECIKMKRMSLNNWPMDFFLLKLCKMVHITRIKVGTDEKDGDIF